jgi:serine/threonine protein kinase
MTNEARRQIHGVSAGLSYRELNELPYLFYVFLLTQGAVHQQASVIHGDLAGRNILITGEGRPLLSDFGLSARIPLTMMTGPDDFKDLPLLTSTSWRRGNCRWSAPELFFGIGIHPSFASDVYSLAGVIYEVRGSS